MTTAVTASPHTVNFAHTTYNLPANCFAGMFVPNAGVIYHIQCCISGIMIYRILQIRLKGMPMCMGHVRSHDLDGTSSVSSPTVSGAGLRMWLPGFQKTRKSSPATGVIWDYILQKGWQTLVCFPFPDLVLVTGLVSNATLGFISLKSSILTHLVFKGDPHLILQLQ